MHKVYSSPDIMMVYHVKNLLENEGIECVIRGEHLATITGGVAPIDAWMEVWVADEDRIPEAQWIVYEVREDSLAAAAVWACPACGEHSEGHFGECWNCGTERP